MTPFNLSPENWFNPPFRDDFVRLGGNANPTIGPLCFEDAALRAAGFAASPSSLLKYHHPAPPATPASKTKAPAMAITIGRRERGRVVVVEVLVGFVVGVFFPE